jgi:single-stranded-DNA-specific exonuclease
MDATVTDGFLGVDASATGRLWRMRPCDERLALALAQRFALPDAIARVLAGRSIGVEAVPDFLDPTVRAALPDPSHLEDMDAAATRLADAIEAGEAIAVFGDYDVDGATSAALLQHYLRAVGHQARIYVPDRLREGYGPNAEALLRLHADGAALVVTVDCGITAHAPLAAAAEAGLDVIVIDHHVAEPALPPAVAVVNPNRLDDASPHKQLAAVGVAFLLVVALNRELRRRGRFANGPEPDLLRWLDLVALGTVCDVVPLTGLNRALVAQGLKQMARRANPGLAALADVARVDGPPNAYHAGFLLGPRVNAGGRVGEADMGARLLTTADPEVGRELAGCLDRYNAERQAIEAEVLAAALRQAGPAAERGDPVIVVAGADWHPGVIGIVASRLVERFGRPAAVVALVDGTGKGSARSVSGVDLGAAVIAARQSGLLVNGGGHKMAAGFTVAADGVGALAAFLNDRLRAAVDDATRTPTLKLDGVLSVDGATLAFAEQLERLAPFGVGNPEPMLVLKGARVAFVDLVGEAHLRCALAGDAGGRLKAIAFRAATEPLGAVLRTGAGQRLHLAGKLRRDTWRGRNDVQFVIEDAAPARLD